MATEFSIVADETVKEQAGWYRRIRGTFEIDTPDTALEMDLSAYISRIERAEVMATETTAGAPGCSLSRWGRNVHLNGSTAHNGILSIIAAVAGSVSGTCLGQFWAEGPMA